MAAKRSDIEKQIAALQAELEGADTDDEIWIKDESGHEIKVSGKRATTVLNRFAKLWETEGDEEDEDEDEQEEADDKGAKDAKTGGYFKSKGK